MTSDRTNGGKPVVFLPPGAKNYVEAKVATHALNDETMDVAFTKAVGCTQYPGGCDGLRKDHRFDDPVPLGENWRHKYLLDLDGMGYSARFFALLSSQSAVLKATVYREYFSDWIQPWCVFLRRNELLAHQLTRLPRLLAGSTSSQSRARTRSSPTSTPTFPARRRPCRPPPTSAIRPATTTTASSARLRARVASG